MLNYRINPEIASNCLNIKQLKLIYIYIYIKYLEINRLYRFFLFPFNFQGGAAARRASVLPCAFGIQGFQNLICNDFTKTGKTVTSTGSVSGNNSTVKKIKKFKIVQKSKKVKLSKCQKNHFDRLSERQQLNKSTNKQVNKHF